MEVAGPIRGVGKWAEDWDDLAAFVVTTLVVMLRKTGWFIFQQK
jgi:hypothetical protein